MHAVADAASEIANGATPVPRVPISQARFRDAPTPLLPSLRRPAGKRPSTGNRDTRMPTDRPGGSAQTAVDPTHADAAPSLLPFEAPGSPSRTGLARDIRISCQRRAASDLLKPEENGINEQSPMNSDVQNSVPFQFQPLLPY